MSHHRLKTWPEFFAPVWSGAKTFEVRFDDRGYQRGDTVTLAEWDRSGECRCLGRGHEDTCARYAGREVLAEVGYVLASTPPRGQQRGFNGYGYVVLSLCSPENRDRRPAVSPADVARLHTAVPIGGLS